MVRILSAAFLIIFSHIALATAENLHTPNTEVLGNVGRILGRQQHTDDLICGKGRCESDDIQLKRLSYSPLCIDTCPGVLKCCENNKVCCAVSDGGGCTCLDIDYCSCHLTGSIRLSQ